jgi:hypothetical protein
LELSSEAWATANIEEEHPLLKKCYPIDNLKKLVTLRSFISEQEFLKESDKLYLFVALNKCLVPCAQVGINIPYVHWSSKREPQETLSSFRRASEIIAEDLKTMSKLGNKGTISNVFPYDSRVKNPDLTEESVSMVFTSPPYLNNFDYAEALKVFLYFWKIVLC